VVRLLQEHEGEVRLIAGGTDLMLMLELEENPPDALIDITRVEPLTKIEIMDDRVTIGAAVTYDKILKNNDIEYAAPFMLDAIGTIGGAQIRSVATLVGNIANASPAGDTLPILYVLGATVHTYGPEGVRHIPIEDFILGVRRINLKPHELITQVSFELPGFDWVGSFQKLGLRGSMAIAVASVAVMVQFDGNQVKEAHIALGSVAPSVIFAHEAEAYLCEHELNDDHIETAIRKAEAIAQPIDDVRGSARYRKLVVGGLLRKGLQSCQRQGQEKGIYAVA
jgi:CO/xanthine dehydrogenase FAD-binding subunit